jgi:flavin-dependent dehydrogenase
VIFDTLGVSEDIESAGLVRHEGQWIDAGRHVEFQRFGEDGATPWLGYQVSASVLDPILLRRATECGVDVRRLPVESPLIRNGRLGGVGIAAGEVPARVVIDTSGRRQWLATCLRLARDKRSPPLTALYGYARAGALDDGRSPMLRLREDGWSWSAPIGEGRSAWVRLARAHEAERARSEAPLLETALRAADVTWRIVQHPAGRGYFLAGDAAFVLDPASSHGVLKALLSGAVAATCAADVLSGANEAAVADEYSRWMRRMFDHDVDRLRSFYASCDVRLLD